MACDEYLPKGIPSEIQLHHWVIRLRCVETTTMPLRVENRLPTDQMLHTTRNSQQHVA